MLEEASLEFRLTKIYETRKYLLGKIKHNDVMSEEYKKTCKYLNYVEYLLILASVITVFVSISAFSSLVSVPVSMTSSVVGIKVCAIIARIKKYKSIVKKMKKKYDKIVQLGKDKLNTIEVLISKAAINSCISHDKFFSVNNILREYNEMKKEIKNPESSVEYTT